MANRVLRFAALLAASWFAMTLTHEAGHIVGGWCGGATLTDADLLPWHLPYSLFDPDPRPLVTLWCGPNLGAAVPQVLALLVRRPSARFIAHFCVRANGAYLAAGWVSGDRYLDTPKLLDHGAPPAAVAAYCVLTIGFGYAGFRRACGAVLSPPGSTR